MLVCVFRGMIRHTACLTRICLHHFSGDQLLGVDVNGVRLALDSLPNDPDLLNELTSHKVHLRSGDPVLLSQSTMLKC